MKLDEMRTDRIDELKAAAALKTAKAVGAKSVGAAGNVARAVGKAAVAGAKKAAPVVGKAAVAAAPVVGKAAVAGAQAAGKVAGKAKDMAMAQRAAQRSRMAGGKSAAKFARGTADIKAGKAVTGAIAQELAPHIANLELILSSPQLMTKWKQLVKQAKQMSKK